MEKAHDHVSWLSWGFLMDIRHRYGFDVKWRNWIKKCVGLATFSVLLNGVSAGYFGCSYSIRQGDPISPLLFLLVVEVLGAMLSKAVSVRMLESFKVGSNQVEVSHL